MRPRRGHGLRHLGGIQVSKDLLDAAQLRDRVDSVCPERLEKLILVVLCKSSVLARSVLMPFRGVRGKRTFASISAKIIPKSRTKPRQGDDKRERAEREREREKGEIGGEQGEKEIQPGKSKHQQQIANIGNITKIKPGLTWLMARGSAGVPGETS